MYPIYCINLEHRKDRKEHTTKEFEKLEIPLNNVIYPHFTKDKRGGIYGCFDSHIQIWNDFFIKYPNEKYCLIFEDDFVITKNSKSIIKKAVKFIDINYKDIDLLFLHNLRVDVDNKINNETFTKGYGLTAHSYFITRHYIQSIINKYGKLPKPNGRHIDVELNQNKFSKDNWLYTEKLFFTNKECMGQLVINNKSDNTNDIFYSFISDVNKRVKYYKKICIVLKKYRILNDAQLKKLYCLVKNI